MNNRMPTAFVTSLTLHGLVVAVLMLMAYTAGLEKKTATKIFELVQGEGDNFAATEAPKLGVPGGIKVSIPAPTTPPMPQPEPPKAEPKVVEPEPAPPVPEVAPAPLPPTPKAAPPKMPADTKSKAPPKSTKTMAEQMNRAQVIAESAAKQKLAKEKAVEKKRLDQERAEAVRQTRSASAPIDTDGIVKGVRDGSAANTKGGAGGKTLTRVDGPVMDAYFAMLRERLLGALRTQSGLSDTLATEVEFRLNVDGSITGAKVIGPSGSPEFDRAVLDVFGRVRMPARPDRRGDVHTIRIRAKDLEG